MRSPEPGGLERQRARFPALRDKLYFNFGALGPMPGEAIESIRDSCLEQQAAGPFSAEGMLLQQYRLARARQQLAAGLACRAERLAFTESVSAACNVVLWGLDWRPGDGVVVTDSEVPGVRAAVAEAARRSGLEVSVLPAAELRNEDDALRAIEAVVGERTRLLVVSHVLWTTGQVLPIELLAEFVRQRPPGRRPRILVDGAQAVGNLAVEPDRLGADFYAFTCSKWLCGPEGIAALHVAPGALDAIRPTFVGWRALDPGAASGSDPWWPDARRFEVATAPFYAYDGLRAALEVHDGWAAPAERSALIGTRGRFLWDELRGMARRRPWITGLSPEAPRAGIVSFELAGVSTASLVDLLEERGILARHLSEPDRARFCVHYLTARSHLESLLDTLDRLLRSGSLLEGASAMER